MRIRITDELIPLNLLILTLILAIIFFPSNVLRIILGIPFIFFFPGYTLVAVLFPRKEGMSGIERVALSFGMSIAIVPFIGLILNYTTWGITLEPMLYSIASFIFVISIIAWVRRRRLWERERFGIEFQFRMSGWGGSARDKVLSIVLVIAILGALGTLGYVIATPKVGGEFTEFYIVGLEGKATDYPRQLVVGEKGRVVVGIVSHERETTSYRVGVRIDGVTQSETGPIVLEHKEKWEGEVSFVPEVASENQKVEFLLYKDGEPDIYSSLHIWIDVKQ